MVWSGTTSVSSPPSRLPLVWSLPWRLRLVFQSGSGSVLIPLRVVTPVSFSGRSCFRPSWVGRLTTQSSLFVQKCFSSSPRRSIFSFLVIPSYTFATIVPTSPSRVLCTRSIPSLSTSRVFLPPRHVSRVILRTFPLQCLISEIWSPTFWVIFLIPRPFQSSAKVVFVCSYDERLYVKSFSFLLVFRQQSSWPLKFSFLVSRSSVTFSRSFLS